MMAYPVRDSFQGYPQQYAMYQTRAHQPQVDVAQSLTVNPYAHFQSAPETQQYIQPQAKSQQPATSIITEDGFRPSLPSISNLLGIADGERGSQDAGTFTQLISLCLYFTYANELQHHNKPNLKLSRKPNNNNRGTSNLRCKRRLNRGNSIRINIMTYQVAREQQYHQLHRRRFATTQ